MNYYARRTDHAYATAKRAFYAIESVSEREVYIADQDNGSRTVTNDAENVARELYEQYGNVCIYYTDTDGNVDQILHDRGEFKGFAPGPAYRRVL